MTADHAGLASFGSLLGQAVLQVADDSAHAHQVLRQWAAVAPSPGSVAGSQSKAVASLVSRVEDASSRAAAGQALVDQAALAVHALRSAVADYSESVQAADRVAPAQDSDLSGQLAEVLAFPGAELTGGALGGESGMAGAGGADQARADAMRQEASDTLRRRCRAIVVDLADAQRAWQQVQQQR